MFKIDHWEQAQRENEENGMNEMNEQRSDEWDFVSMQKRRSERASEAEEGRKGRKSNLHLNVHFFKQRFVTAIWAENFLQHERSFLTIAAAAETFSSLGWVSKVASKPGLLAVSYYDAWVRIAHFCSNTQTGDTCFLTFF